MAQTQNFGDTISNGIQDIAALLPLLGTEQCERHVGEALQKGYLYAAATPLSIFGSLGVVKTSFATFLAATTKPFYGGNWLQDAGFATAGSVASMVTLSPGTKRYGAELQLERLMKEQHIKNPEMISNIERFGWKKDEGTDAGLKRLYPSWNLCLVLTSALASIIALTPYIYLARHDPRNALVWIFPAFRSFGSFLCVVSIQLALQRRIYHITSSSLLLMKETYRNPPTIEQSKKEQDMLLEARLKQLSKQRTSDLEKGPTSETQRSHGEGIPAPRSVHLTLVILQVSLAVGMGMIVTGYVGCFNLVSQTSAKNGPYVWFGVEAALSISRLVLWGSNPSWDEQGTGLTVRLALLPKSRPASADAEERNYLDVCPDPELFPIAQAQQSPTTDHMFPFITSPHHISLLTNKPMAYYVDQDKEWIVSFVAHGVEDFLAATTPYVGPLERIEVDGSSIYYAVLAELSDKTSQKLLCVTAVPHGARWNSLSFLLRGGKTQHSTFLSRTRQLTGTRALEVTFVEELEDASTGFLDSQSISLIIDYSNTLLCRLVAPPDMDSDLHLSWSLQVFSGTPSQSCSEALPPTPTPPLPPPLLSHLDREYMQIGQVCDLKGDYCLSRSGNMNGVTFPYLGSTERILTYKEYALMFNSAILETYLCIMDHRFVRHAGLSDTLSHQLRLQWIQKMEARLSAEKLATNERHYNRLESSNSPQRYRETWDTLSSEIRSLRLLPANDPVLQQWEAILYHTIQFGHSPHFSMLFSLKPLAAASELINFLHPSFTDDERLSDPYHDLIAYVRLSIQRLRSITPPPCFGRMDPDGPGSPEFSPPYMCINSALIEGSKDKFIAQMHLIEILHLPNAITSWKGVFSILYSLPSLPPTFTTLVLSNLSFTLERFHELLSLVKKHRNLMFFIHNECHNYVGPKGLAKVTHTIVRNRRKWRNHALQLRLPHYQIGLQPPQQDSNPEGGRPLPLCMSHGHEMCLRYDVRVVAMVYIPYYGKIIPILLAKGLTSRGGGAFVASIYQWRQDNLLDDRWEVDNMKKTVHSSKWSKWVPLRFDAFSEVAPGCYQVHIHGEEVNQYVFKKLEIKFVPTHQFQFSLHSPAGQHHGSVTVSPSEGTAPDSPLVKLTMGLLPATSGVSLDFLWVISEEQDRSPTQVASHSYSFTPNKPGPNYSSESVPPPTYRFQFSLRNPEGHRHHGSFIFSPETTDHKLENFIMVLDPLSNKLRLDRRWLVSSFGHAVRVAEEGMVQEQTALDSSEIDGFFEPSLPREQEDQPQGSEESSEESSEEPSEESSDETSENATGRRGDEDSRIFVVPSPPDESVLP
ncbi:hypothetical protein PQX77_019981 [Marasmius sp. AFHP31]|nr:hypothetical protein PQX77_019981 [Marasmius sp. AFHP31]